MSGKHHPAGAVPSGTDGIACGRFGATRREWVAVAAQDRSQDRSPLDLTVAGHPCDWRRARLLSGPQLLADKAEYLPSDGLDVKRALLIVLEKTRDPVKLQIAQKRTFNAFGDIVGILYAV